MTCTRLTGKTYLVGIYTASWPLEDTEVMVDVTSDTYTPEPHSYASGAIWSRDVTVYTAEIIAIRFPDAWVAADLACQLLGRAAIGEAETRLTDALNDGTAEQHDWLQRVPCITAPHDQTEDAS